MNRSLVCKTWKRDFKSMGLQRAAGSQLAECHRRKLSPRRGCDHAGSLVLCLNVLTILSEEESLESFFQGEGYVPVGASEGSPYTLRKADRKDSTAVHLCVSVTRMRNVQIAWHSSGLGLCVICFQRRLAFASMYPVKRVCYCQRGWCVTQLWTEGRKRQKKNEFSVLS